MDRFFCHYKELEETYPNLWKTGIDKEMVTKSKELLSSKERFSQAIDKLFTDWQKSCLFNLTNDQQNRIAFIGQASCCVNHGANNNETKEAWFLLTDVQRKDANSVARTNLNRWEINQQNDLFGGLK